MVNFALSSWTNQDITYAMAVIMVMVAIQPLVARSLISIYNMVVENGVVRVFGLLG